MDAAQASWILVKPQEELTERERRALDLMRSADEAVATANTLVQQFVNMVRQRQADRLAPWTETASLCSVPAIARFANNLLNDFAAVHNALLLSWSNGQVEGQVHRLKLIKRQMYGRANFDLLRKRVIGLPQCD